MHSLKAQRTLLTTQNSPLSLLLKSISNLIETSRPDTALDTALKIAGIEVRLKRSVKARECQMLVEQTTLKLRSIGEARFLGLFRMAEISEIFIVKVPSWRHERLRR